jgi:hypothetical protein
LEPKLEVVEDMVDVEEMEDMEIMEVGVDMEEVILQVPLMLLQVLVLEIGE